MEKKEGHNTNQQQARSSGLAAVGVQHGPGGLLCSPEHILSERSVSLSACSGCEGWAQVAASDTGEGCGGSAREGRRTSGDRPGPGSARITGTFSP